MRNRSSNASIGETTVRYMNGMTHLGTLTLLSLMTLFAGCAGLWDRPDPPRIDIAGLKLKDADLFEQRFALTLRLQNANETDIDVRGMDYEVFLNDDLFAHGVRSQRITIPAFTEELVELEVTSNLLRLFNGLVELENALDSGVTYRLAGEIKLANWPAKIPFEHTGKLKP